MGTYWHVDPFSSSHVVDVQGVESVLTLLPEYVSLTLPACWS